MNVVSVYARLYGSCLRQALKGIRKNLWTLLLPMGLSFLFFAMAMLLGSILGQASGFVIAFVIDALFSAYLYFVSETVQHSKVSLADFWRSLGAYFWSIVNVMFILFLTGLMLDYALARNPNADLIRLAILALEFVFLNAVPEILYQRNTYGFSSIIESAKFIQENWIEWLVPHVLLAAAVYFAFPPLLQTMALNPLGLFSLGVPLAIVGGALLHVLMVFRGHLFDALSGSTHRQRMFRYRAPGT